MSDQADLTEVLSALAGVLGSRGTSWYLFGAQAVAIYGVPRLTVDVDATIDSSADDVEDLASALVSAGFVSRVPDVRAFVSDTRVLPVTHVATGTPVDLVIAGPGLEEAFLARARPTDLGGVVIPVIAPEDLITTKILAGRPKDLEDVLGMLRGRSDDLDVGMCRDTLRLLEEALDRSDLVSTLDGLVRDAR